MKTRVYNVHDKAYNQKAHLVSTDGKFAPVFMGSDYMDDEAVEAELATDVYLNGQELYENDMIELANHLHGLVAMEKGQYGLRVAQWTDELLAERSGLLNQPNLFVPFMTADMVAYEGTVHDFENAEAEE